MHYKLSLWQPVHRAHSLMSLFQEVGTILSYGQMLYLCKPETS